MEQAQPIPWQHRLDEFLADQRVRISVVGVLLLATVYVGTGHRPRDVANWRDPLVLLGLVLWAFGLAVRSWAASVIRKGKALAMTGPYSLCRHPLYVGSFSIMLGVCILLDHAMNYMVLVPVLVLYLFTIRREERKLARKYGSEWTDYARRTSRFFPVRWPAGFKMDWTFQQWMKRREYNALAASALVLILMRLWVMI